MKMTREAFEEKYISPLNDQQREAVKAVDGAVLLLAVPGSGKTTVLVTRLGYMVLCRGIDPASILTMTYTIAATEDMKKRFLARFGPEYASQLEFRTINGVSARIIRYYSTHHSRRPAFALLDNDGELDRIVRQIYQEVNEENPEGNTVKDIRTAITFIKNMMLTNEEIAGLHAGIKNLLEIYLRYQDELKRRRVMDYDDQMCYAKRILERHPSVLEHFQEQYRYLCVDEAQDTSKIQHAIIQILAQKYGNLFMVGDEDQSIFGFRAAWPDALMRFGEDHPGARILLMERNYRSTEEIVSVANAFIAGNRFRHPKTIRATQGSGEPVRVIPAARREAQYQHLFHVAQTCETETAALYRNNESALPLLDILERSGVPYNLQKLSGTFFSNRLVLDITDIIHFATNPMDQQTFLRICHKLDIPISNRAAQWACQRSQHSGKAILEELRSFPEMKGPVRNMVTDLIQTLPLVLKDTALNALHRIWYDIRYEQYAKWAMLDTNKYDILQILAAKEATAESLLRRLSDLKTLIQNHQNRPEVKFILSTIHSSKGLEYENVYMLDILDGILPSKLPDQEELLPNEEDWKLYEEERRLYYVGITRAKRLLYLFSCDQESAFTREVSARLSRADKESSVSPHTGPSAIPKLKEDVTANDIPQLACGMEIFHKKFGKGRIISIEGETLEVFFTEQNESKRLVRSFVLKNHMLKTL